MTQRTSNPKDRPCIIVSGLGRCGSSLVMQMLHAGGVECLGAPPAFEPPESSPMYLTRDWMRGPPGAEVGDDLRAAFRGVRQAGAAAEIRTTPRRTTMNSHATATPAACQTPARTRDGLRWTHSLWSRSIAP